MSTDDGFDPLLTDWLSAEASEQEPPGFHARVVALAGHAHQRPPWQRALGIDVRVPIPGAHVYGRRTVALLVVMALLLALAVAAAALLGAHPSPRLGYTDGFTPTAPLAEARGERTATLLSDGRVLIVGGIAGGMNSPLRVGSAELWDPATESFSPAGSLATPRGQHLAVRVPGDRVLIVGGSGVDGVVATAELWDPATRTFSAAGSLGPELPAGAMLLPDGHVLAILAGPYSRSSGAVAELWDPRTESFAANTGPAGIRGLSTATLLPSGEVLIVGYGSSELWDPVAMTSRSTGPVSVGPQFHTATLLPDGSVLIVGGDQPSHPSTAQSRPTTAELWDPATQTFSAAGSFLGAWREGLTATLLQDGRVLVIGGGGFEATPHAYGDAFLWDPVSRSFTQAASPDVARMDHTATSLKDGRVLIAGGRGVDGVRVASAELYH